MTGEVEDEKHFMLDCKTYQIMREEMFEKRTYCKYIECACQCNVTFYATAFPAFLQHA